MPRKRKEWWERSMNIFFREKRDPKKFQEAFQDRVREMRKEIAKYGEELREDVKMLNKKFKQR